MLQVPGIYHGTFRHPVIFCTIVSFCLCEHNYVSVANELVWWRIAPLTVNVYYSVVLPLLAVGRTTGRPAGRSSRYQHAAGAQGPWRPALPAASGFVLLRVLAHTYAHTGQRRNMDILNSIVEWNRERGLDKQPSNRTSATRMLMEELLEYNGIEDIEMLNALTNHVVAGPPVDADEKVDALCDLIVIATGELLKMGYDPNKAMDETIKEISSRTGSFNEASGKWEKFKTPEAQALWYTAQYGKAKLISD